LCGFVAQHAAIDSNRKVKFKCPNEIQREYMEMIEKVQGVNTVAAFRRKGI